jgi:hypothetical protein
MKFRHHLRLIVSLVVLCLCVGFFAWKGLTNWFNSSEYSRAVINLPDGTNVFAVQQRWRHRRQIYLTLDSDGCKPANSKTDYVFPNESVTVVVYRVTSNGITIFSDMRPDQVEQPSVPWPQGNPTVVIATNPEIEDLVRDPQHFGVSVTDISQSEICWLNLFRVANSFDRRVARPNQNEGAPS